MAQANVKIIGTIAGLGLILVYLAGPALPTWLIAATVAFVAGLLIGENVRS